MSKIMNRTERNKFNGTVFDGPFEPISKKTLPSNDTVYLDGDHIIYMYICVNGEFMENVAFDKNTDLVRIHLEKIMYPFVWVFALIRTRTYLSLVPIKNLHFLLYISRIVYD